MTESDPKARSLGYARVSTYGQTLDAQLEQLHKEGCSKIYCEKASGAQPERRELLRLLKAVAAGDVVTVTRIDRLARSTLRGGAVGGHIHQHRAADDCGVRRPGRRGARFDPHAHGGGAHQGKSARAAHGPSAEVDARAAA